MTQNFQKVIFSPRSVNSHHGTGVQVSILKQVLGEEIDCLNFGAREFGMSSSVPRFETKVESLWRFENRLRRLYFSSYNLLPTRYWHGNQLTSAGRKAFKKTIDYGSKFSLAILDSESSSERFYSMVSSTECEYSIILYDYFVPGTLRDDTFYWIEKCVKRATSVYSISEPLRHLAERFGASRTREIDFFRLPPAFTHKVKVLPPNIFKIAILGTVPALVLDEVIECLEDLYRTTRNKIELHYIGNPLSQVVPHYEGIQIIDHGFLSDSKRDERISCCDLGIIAGHVRPPETCPHSRYSVPSKMGDFLAIGLPFVVRTAESSATDQWIKNRIPNVAAVAHKQQSLRDEVLRLMSSHDLRRSRSGIGLDFARNFILAPNGVTSLAQKFRSDEAIALSSC